MAAASLKESPSIQNGHSVIRETDASGLNIKDQVIENFRPMSVIIIGAGFSGIYLGVRIPELLRNVKLTIYEKNAGVGGTWYENRYPGCACDIPGTCIVANCYPITDDSPKRIPTNTRSLQIQIGAASMHQLRKFETT
jgi:cation diffusion facilitator CzcD-associated flavoprotein CzcO